MSQGRRGRRVRTRRDAPATEETPSEVSGPIPEEERMALAKAIDSQRSQFWRAHAITLTAARLLHETYDFEEGEPDIAYALDAVVQIVEIAIDCLEPLNLKLPIPTD